MWRSRESALCGRTVSGRSWTGMGSCLAGVRGARKAVGNESKAMGRPCKACGNDVAFVLNGMGVLGGL